MKRYIRSSELLKPQDLSKERLELIISEIVNIINTPELGSSGQLLQIIKILEFMKLR